MTDTSPTDDTLPARRVLLAFLQENLSPLTAAVRLYVYRSHLAEGSALSAVTAEILQDVVVEALSHCDRFDPDRQPMAWLRGIAINVIKRQLAARTLRAHRELLMPEFSQSQPSQAPGSDPIDRLGEDVQEGPDKLVEADEQAATLLSLVSADDQRILRLVVLEDVSGETLAASLGISPGAARMRLHRALDRLRSAWTTMQTAEATQPYQQKGVKQRD